MSKDYRFGASVLGGNHRSEEMLLVQFLVGVMSITLGFTILLGEEQYKIVARKSTIVSKGGNWIARDGR